MQCPPLAAAIALALAVPYPVHAAVAPPAESAMPEPAIAQAPAADVTSLDSIQVSAARHEARRDDTASRIVFDSEALRSHGDTQLLDALRRLPGVSVGTSTPGGGGSIALRGMGAAHTQILVDGEQPPAGFSIESLSPEQVERVELIRAATADQRAEAIGGTLNIVLAGTARSQGDTLRATWATASNGTHVPTLVWERSRKRKDREAGLVVTANRRAFEVIEHGGERGVDGNGTPILERSTRLRAVGARERISAAPTLDLQLDADNALRLQATAEGSRFQRTTDIDWNTSLGEPLRYASYRQNTDLDVALLQTSARWQRQLAAGGSFETRLAIGGNRERSAWRELARDDAGKPNLLDQTDATLRVMGVSSSGRHQLPTHGRHALQFGWEASLDRRRDSRRQALHHFGLAEDSVLDLSSDAQVRRYAAYAQDEFSITPRWSLYLGGRLERIETRGDGAALPPVRTARQVASPVLQSLWKLPGNKDARVRAALSRTFKAPTLAQLSTRPYTNSNNRPLDPDLIGNPALRPELATGLDLAYERGSGNGLRFNVGGYVRQIEDSVRTELIERNGRWVRMPINGGDALAWGLEVDGGLPLSALFKGAPAVDLRYSATRAWSRVKQVAGPWNLLPEQTPFSANVGADARFSPQWSAGASFTYSSSARIQSNATVLELESAKRLLDMYVLWRPDPGLSLRLSVSDLLRDGPRSGERTTIDGNVQQSLRVRRGTALWQAQLESRW